MAQHENDSQINSTPAPSQESFNYNSYYNYGSYYLQGNTYNSMYYTNNATSTGHNIPTTNTNNLAYSPLYNHNTNYTQPESTEQSIANNIGQNTTGAQSDIHNVLNPSQIPHFWDDCEYINYKQGADSCSMCSEEVEDDDELQAHLKTQHHVVFYACTTCRTVYSDLNAFRSHDCHPYVAPEPPTATQSLSQSHIYDKKRKRGPPPLPKKPPSPIPEKQRLNDFGAVYVSPQKRARQKSTPGLVHVQGILQWQQSYNVNPPQQEQTGGELVVRDEVEDGTIPLTRELLLEAQQSTDGLPVEIDKLPGSAILCKTCCLLFASSYQLNRHAGFSKTHKKNVDIQRRQEQKAIRFDVTGDTSQKTPPLSDSSTYRDRSAERRAENPEGCPLDYQPYDAVTDYVSPDAPIEASNVGRKLLESMGWKEGNGLGKNGVGIVNPITPQKTFRGAGLGTEINQYEVDAHEASTYSDYLRNKKFARYAQLSKTIRDPVEPS